MRSKIKIRTSLADKANSALWANEVRILIFDDPAEQEEPQCPHFHSAQLYSSTTSVTIYNTILYPWLS